MKNSQVVVWRLRKQTMLNLISGLIGIVGLVNIISGLFPALRSRQHVLSIVLSPEFQVGSRLMTIFVGFLLLLMVNQLLNHKKMAWWLTQGLLISSVLTHLAKGLDMEEASLALGMFVILLFLRSLFRARSDPVYLRSVPQRAAISAIALVIYGMVGFGLMNRGRIFNWQEALGNTTNTVFGLDYQREIHTHRVRWFVDSLYMMGIAWYAYLLILVLSPVLIRQRPTMYEREKVKTLVNRYGSTALGMAALHRDKLYFFAKTGSVIVYVLVSGVALVLGEPVGRDAEMEESVREFGALARDNGWIVAFYQIRDGYSSLWEKLNFKLLPIGQTGIVNLVEFGLEGGKSKEFRYVMNKLEKANYKVEVSLKDHEAKLMMQLARVSQAWLASKRMREMTFSMGSFDVEYLADKPLVILRNERDETVAFVSLLPNPRLEEIGIDLMRFLPDLPNGAMDYLFTKTILWAKGENFRRLDLGMSPLSGVGEMETDPWIAKALQVIFRRVEIFYNFMGLHNFKRKFNPVWQMRYLAYRKDRQLAQIGAALLRAHQGKIRE